MGDDKAREEWRPVVGWEGWYSISSLGNVRSEDRVITRTDGLTARIPGKMLTPHRKQRGHRWVCLMRNSRPTRASVHRLVLEAFVGPCPDGMEGCHWDDNPDNNRVENLRWASRRDNLKDGVRNGRNANANKTHCANGHEYTPNNTISVVRASGDRYRLCYECRKVNNRRAWYAREARRRARIAESEANGA